MLAGHSVRHGGRTRPGLPSLDVSDALAGADTADLAGTAADQVTPSGDDEEGQIVRPIAPADLKTRYTR